MTPEAFIAKWSGASLTERAGSQTHFNDLCRLLDVEDPTTADPKGAWYCFERGANKTTGTRGWADVWKRGHFGWEYKGRHRDLDAAYAQLQQYAVALENPPLLVTCDMLRFVIRTNWTNTVSEKHELTLDDLREPAKREMLRAVFVEPERFKPAKTITALTREAAEKFAALAITLREKGHDAHTVAHFVNRLVFCMFAEDIGLLPRELFSELLERAFFDPSIAEPGLRELFAKMRDGGMFGMQRVDWFNGGLFDDDTALPLARDELKIVKDAAALDWADIDPSIFGTLFERGLDPDKRSQLGAHYTDPDKIMLIVNPVIVEPLTREWEAARAEIETAVARAHEAQAEIRALEEEAGAAFALSGEVDEAADRKAWNRRRALRAEITRARNTARDRHQAYLERLRTFRVLDPACGSGNFLYLALLQLKDLEHRANLDAEALGLERPAPQVGPEAVKGIEINPYAAELARVTVWIGEIQWMRKNGFAANRNPVLKPLDTIECRDALVTAGDAVASWPVVDVIIGNPPFLGGLVTLSVLGEDYTKKIRERYIDIVPAGADLVLYWFAKAYAALIDKRAERFGLVATNSIRGGINRRVLYKIASDLEIFNAWSDLPWINDGAAVRVSLICATALPSQEVAQLNGDAVVEIYSDLTPRHGNSGTDLTISKKLHENVNTAFIGGMKKGSFDIDYNTAKDILLSSPNPNGLPNSDVVKPWMNGFDITRRPQNQWIIDFGVDTSLAQAQLYEKPFAHVAAVVKPKRDQTRNERERSRWWLHARSAPDLRRAVQSLSRFIATARVAKFRLFVWLQPPVVCDGQIVIIARDDDTTFGILHSRFHELWSLRMGTWLGKGNDPRYTPTTTFETFPFPEGLTPNVPAADYADEPRAQRIAEVAERLNATREAWLNPPELVRREPEVVPGYPDRLLPVDDAAARELKKRTLTNLYNQRPAWLDQLHRELDEAVAAAYGWPADLADEDILERLLALNLERAARQ